jgi:ElaB/YqjD/DUF883 family membrane-anchored ribosome-binding protein
MDFLRNAFAELQFREIRWPPLHSASRLDKHAHRLNKTYASAFCGHANTRITVMPQSSYGSTSDKMSDLKDKASERVSRAADQVEGMANRVAEQGREAGEGMQEVAGNFKGVLDRSIKDQPMATLAGAAVVGFVLGAIWKS